jgi:GDPmannose 4,6-dehydratase
LDEASFQLTDIDITDLHACQKVIEDFQPDEVYNLAAQSSVGDSLTEPLMTNMINSIVPLNLLEAIRTVNPAIRFFQPGSSEMFGESEGGPSNEESVFAPKNPYGFSKLSAHNQVLNYRDTYGIFAANGILFNHESSLRSPAFVSRKISSGVARVHLGYSDCLELGSLHSQRDWGYAPEYVNGMWLILQHSVPEDFVLATGKSDSVGDFAKACFLQIDVNLEFTGQGNREVGICSKSGKTLVKVNPTFVRSKDVQKVVGDASKAWQFLGWQSSVNLAELSKIMVSCDISRLTEKQMPSN